MTTIVANALDEAEASNAILERPATEEHNAPYDPPDCTRRDDNSPPHLSVMGTDDENFIPQSCKARGRVCESRAD